MAALTALCDARRKAGGFMRYPVVATTEAFKGGQAALSGPSPRRQAADPPLRGGRVRGD